MTQTAKKSPFSMNVDLMHGPIFKNLLLFMLPIFISSLFQQLYNTVDTMIVGNVLGDTALAAIGSCGSIYELLVGFGLGIGNGLAIVAARSYGAQDHDLLKKTVAGSLVIGLVASICITLAGVLGLHTLLLMLDTPAEILDDAYRYILTIDLGVLVMFAYNLCAGLLRAIGNSVMPLVFLLISSGLNVVLDLLFIARMGMGVQGAAVATVLSQVFSFAICAAGLKRLEFVSLLDGSKSKNARLAVRMLKTGLPVGIMSMVTAVGGMILQFFVNDLGASAVAAYAASTKIRSVIGEFSNALGMTFMTFVGQNYGAQKYDRIKDGVRMGVILSILIHIPLSAIEIFGGKRIASLMVTDPSVLELCRQYLLIVGIFVFFLGFLMVFRNCIQGMGNTWIPMLSGGLEVISRLIFGYWLGRHSFMGIAAAEASAWISVSIMLGSSFFILFRKVLRTQTPENTTDTKNIRTIS